MGMIFKTLLLLFIASSFLLVGYQAVKYTRDTVRIWNVKTLISGVDTYHAKYGKIPLSGKDYSLSAILKEEKIIDKEIRDPVFTSATVLMDEYAHSLIRIFSQVAKYAPKELSDNMDMLKEISETAIEPDFVIAYISDGKDYEISVKLESRFLQAKAQDDNGNDDTRYEAGSDLSLETAIEVHPSGKFIRAKGESVSIIK
ncbi:hypothetical protein HON22_05445 [Candidatus Peregrinibacteria bacterium]|mgnify:CR=1 FL=1|jgi:hypothetical protein|nr:hypothetical protein [Candidatus Peregrinibacteria bacterium]